eukprot:4679238-Prymnesium_polylepis.1
MHDAEVHPDTTRYAERSGRTGTDHPANDRRYKCAHGSAPRKHQTSLRGLAGLLWRLNRANVAVGLGVDISKHLKKFAMLANKLAHFPQIPHPYSLAHVNSLRRNLSRHPSDQ